MIVKKYIEDIKRVYELILSREDFDHLCAGCPENDSVIGRGDDGVYFHLFNGLDKISDSFRPMPDLDGYFAYIGVRNKALPVNFTDEDFNRESQIFYDDLENAINESGRIPIEAEGTFNKPLNLGYVIMKVEPIKKEANQAI